MTFERKHERILAEALVRRMLGRASGQTEEYCYFDRPRNRYFIGSLATVVEDQQGNRIENHYMKRIAPNAMGLEVLIERLPHEQEQKILVKPFFSLYFRVFPTFEEQKTMLELQDQVHQIEESEGNEQDELLIKYQRYVPKIEPMEVVLREGINEFKFNEIFRRAIGEMKSNPHSFRGKGQINEVSVPLFGTEEEFESYLLGLTHDVGLPSWEVKVTVEVKESDDGFRVKGWLSNETVNDKSKRSHDGYLFETQLEFDLLENRGASFEFDAIPEDYRYDKALDGYGHNCVVEYDRERNCFQTVYAPIHHQKRYVTRNTKVEAPFVELARAPISVLENIYQEMLEYYEGWNNYVQLDLGTKAFNTFSDAVQSGRDSFSKEIERFRRGIDVLKDSSKPLLIKAFQLMNQVFVRQDAARKKPYRSWRLFQIVYIVSIIPDIASREYSDIQNDLDVVDVLWFPTGGGKTETYLGLVLFNAFFDRLRGKKAGVTAWTRFPLRLLSLQQLQRIADAIGQAELIRRDTPEINTSDNEPFSVGYLVGDENTPNALIKGNDRESSRFEMFKRSPDLMQRYKIITKCPFCKNTSIRMELLIDEIRLVHVCTNELCSEHVLPIYVVDNEVYRYLPTMIVGTVDKLSAVGNQRKFAHLFGHVTHKCPKHGYMSAGECTEKYGCDFHAPGGRGPKPFKVVHLKDPSPSLQIQDELHLLREGLGTFNSHYETFVDYLQHEIQDGVRQKIIAATATIENYDNQIRHMYRRSSRRFPESGPTLGESFYATTLQDVHRLFVGIMAHNKTHINTIIEILQIYHEEIQRLKLNLAEGRQNVGLNDISDSDFAELLSLYEISLTYLLTKREGDRLDQSIDGQVSAYLRRQQLRPLNNVSLTGSTSFDEVGRILDTLENPPQDVENRITSVTATSMISHGVDVARFNFMTFFGMPTQIAEYIQSSSRVGRTYVGIVFLCFNPSRERDQSHYHFFGKYHEYQDRLVEPVPINRWSKFSVDKTLPGIFNALLLNIYYYKFSKNTYFAEEVQKLIVSGKLTKADVVERLKESYGIGDSGSDYFGYRIEELIHKFFDQLQNPKGKFVSESLEMKPMNSLRDVDEPISFQIEQSSYDIFQSLGKGRK